MFISVQKHPAKARHFMTLDLDTNKFIKHVIWSDDKTGEYCVLVTDNEGKFIHAVVIMEKKIAKTKIKKGNIKLIDLNEISEEQRKEYLNEA